MASEADRKRVRSDEEGAGRRVKKRPRRDEDRTSSERELALHASDEEDLFSLRKLMTSKDVLEPPLEISPSGYPSSDGGSSFQLMKTEEEDRAKDVKKKSRKYRGATEKNLEVERERGRSERKGKDLKRYKSEEDVDLRGYKRSSSARSSPHQSSDVGRKARSREGDDRYLYPPPSRSDPRYHSRERIRKVGGDDRRGEEYRGSDGRRGGRKGRDDMYQRQSVSPRPGELRKLERRGEPKATSRGDREGYSDRRDRSDPQRRARHDREPVVRKHHRRKRSHSSRLEEKEHEKRMRDKVRESSLVSGESESRVMSPHGDKIEDWIKELEGDNESESQQDRHGNENGSSSSGESESSREDDVKIRHKKRQRDRAGHDSNASDSERSEEGEIIDENESSENGSVKEDEGSGHLVESHSELSRSATEPILKSKFDDSSGSTSEGEEHLKSKKEKFQKGGSFMQRAQVAYSGYAEVVSGSDHSDNEIDEKSQVVTSSDVDRDIIEDGEAKKAVDTNKEESGVQQKQVDDTEEQTEEEEEEDGVSNLPPYLPALMGCRNVEEYEWLNRIEEGTYGVVYRAKDKKSGEVVALKKLKMEKEKEGFPITSLREINMLLKAKHPNIVFVRELVVGSNMDRIYIVMDYVEHDMKALMETMKQPFLEGEVKTLLIQLLRAVHHLHDNWILHRDLKTSNLLLSHKGILKVGDFGLAREYGSPLRQYTPVVVTLWYRAPELLLGCKTYSTPVDMWSVGCIFAEFLQHKPIFMGKSEIDQLNQIFKELGTPSEEIWPGYNELPVVKKVTFTKRPYNNLRKRFPYLTQSGFDLLNKFLTYDPKRRITGEKALEDVYFKESPLPVDPSVFPTWPAKSEKLRRKSREKSPTPPIGGNYLLSQAEEDGFKITTAVHGKAAVGAGFSLKF